MTLKLYTAILWLVTPLVKLLSNFYVSFSKKKVTGYHYFLYRDLIDVGTVLLTKTNGEFTNFINPVSKEVKHGALCIGYIDGIPTVLEATRNGVVYTDLVTFLTTKDRVIGVKPLFLSNVDKTYIPVEAEKRIGIQYDYLFKSGNKAFYCFELIADTFKGAKPSVILKEEEILKGYKIYDESTFLDEKKFLKLFDSRIN